MRFANMLFYNEGNPRHEGFLPTEIVRIRPKDAACQVLMHDEGTSMLQWIDLDMSFDDAKNEIDRALVEMGEELVQAYEAQARRSSGPRADTDTDLIPASSIDPRLASANACPTCRGTHEAHVQEVPPDKVRAIMYCPTCNPKLIQDPARFFYAIGRDRCTEGAVEQALRKWNEITVAPGDEDPLDRR